jgi:hypothetical protein
MERTYTTTKAKKSLFFLLPAKSDALPLKKSIRLTGRSCGRAPSG